MKFSRLIVLTQRLVWARTWEFRCSSFMWMHLMMNDVPPSILQAIAGCRPFLIGPVTFRLETDIERSIRLRYGSVPSVPLIPRSIQDEDR